MSENSLNDELKKNNGNNNSKNVDGDKLNDELKSMNESGEKLMTRDEYTASLRQWMHQCYFWNQTRLMNQSIILSSFIAFNQQINNLSNHNQTNLNTNTRNQDGIFKVPKLWKRAAAEFIDFILLFIIKAVITYIVIDYFELFDDFKDNLITFDGNFDAYKMTSHLTILELIHRLIVIIFETLFIYRNGRNVAGGSTPGKLIFGLKVISCNEVLDYGNGEIRVYSGENIALWRCLLRAFIKSLSSIILPPTLIALYASKHHRGLCDYIAMTIVVENRA